MTNPNLHFTTLTPDTPDLTYAHYGDSGLDLYSSEDGWVLPFQSKLFPSGIAVELPKGFEAQVRPRSSMSKASWLQNIGTVDNPYTGEIGIVIYNGSIFPRRIRKGQKIAQLVIAPVAYCRVFKRIIGPDDVSHLEEVPQPGPGSANRGDKGFGSTGS